MGDRKKKTEVKCERAGNGTRTRDPNLGKVVLYQLSYSRTRDGGEGNRTPDLLNAIQALSQLSYAPRPKPAAFWAAGQEPQIVLTGTYDVKKTALA